MAEPERIIALRRANESQPCGVDSWGFPVGQFARELEELRRANAAVYAAAKGERGETRRAVRR